MFFCNSPFAMFSNTGVAMRVAMETQYSRSESGAFRGVFAGSEDASIKTMTSVNSLETVLLVIIQ